MRFGLLNVEDLCYGGQPISAAYVGGVQVWPADNGLLAGQLIASSILAGDVVIVRQVGGALVAVSAFAGGLVRNVTFAGDMATVSTFSGALIVSQDILFDGALLASSDISAELAALRGLAGVILAQSAAQGTMARTAGLVAAVGALSAVSGGVAIGRGLGAALSAVSALSAALTVVPSAVSSVSLHASVASFSPTLTWPGTIAAGDVAVVCDYARSTGDITEVPLSGFTSIAGAEQGYESSGDNEAGRVWYKILTGSESGSFSTMGASDNGTVLLIFRGNIPITSVSPGGWQSDMTGNDPASQIVAASGGAVPLVVIGVAASSATPSFSTASPAFDGLITVSGSELLAGYKIYESSPVNHTVDMGDVGNDNYLSSGYLEFA